MTTVDVMKKKFDKLVESLSTVYPDLKGIIELKAVIDGKERDLFMFDTVDSIYLSMYAMYNMTPWLKKGTSLADVEKYLKSQKWESVKQIVRSLPIFEEENLSLQSFYQTFKDGADDSEGLPCVFCGSRSTRSWSRQERSGDESESVYTKCFKCGKLHKQR